MDGTGNRTQRIDDLGTHTYDYDDLYRLTEVTYPGPANVDYTYDAVGNRLTMVTSAGTTDYDYDAADRLVSVDPPGASPMTYTWDDNGNLTARGADSFVWDAEDRMTSATVASLTTTFAYNGDGLRDSLTVSANTTTFTWDVNTSIPQVLDDEDFRYVYGLGLISMTDSSGVQSYRLTDGLGSTMALTDDDGDVVNTYDYDVFGADRASTGMHANDFTFMAQQFDSSTGLQFLKARYYDPTAGRFLGRDRFGGSDLLPMSQNAYAFAHANPILWRDPLGLCIVVCKVNVPDPIGVVKKGLSDGAQKFAEVTGIDKGYVEIGASGCGLPTLPLGPCRGCRCAIRWRFTSPILGLWNGYHRVERQCYCVP